MAMRWFGQRRTTSEREGVGDRAPAAPGRTALREALVRALREQRTEAVLRLAELRVAGAGAFLLISAYLGLLKGREDWRVYVQPLLLYLLVAAGLLAVLRRAPASFQILGANAVPWLDVPAACALQLRSLPLSPSPSGVAGWSLGLFVMLVVLSALSLRRRVLYATIATGWAAEGLLQRAADVSWGAVAASGVVLTLAAGATTWATRRLESLLERLVGEETERRRATERSEELERTSAALARANAELQAAQQEAETLTSLLVHDLKGPLTAVLGTIELVRTRAQSRPDAAPVVGGLEIAEDAARRLLRMIGDLLSVSRLERGAMAPEPTPTDLGRLLVEIARAYAATAEAHGVALRPEVEPGLTAEVDPELLRRMVENLISNALSFVRPGGRVELTAARDGATWRLAVRNDGPPVPAEARGRLFQRFASAREQVGAHAGLGLYLCRLVAESHGGTVGIEDEPGWPVSFVARLPLDGRPAQRP